MLIHSNGINYYKSIQSNYELLKGADERSISNLVHAIINKKDIEDDLVSFESSLTNKLRIEVPDFFDNIEREESLLHKTLDYIITHYNKCINEKNDVLLEFQKIEAIAKAKTNKICFSI